MKVQTCYITVLLWLLRVLAIRGKETKFDKKEIRECVAHNVEKVSNPLLFPLNNGSIAIIVEVHSLPKVALTVTSMNGTNELVLQRCSQDSFCTYCDYQMPIPFLLESVFRLSFLKRSIVLLGSKNQTTICTDLSTEFSEELIIDFRLVNPVEYSFKGYFTLNCKKESCWMFPELNFQVIPKVSETYVFYFRDNEENGTAYLHGLGERIPLFPTQWWKKLTVMIEKEKPTSAQILSVRDDEQLVLMRKLGPLVLKLEMWTESSPGVFWTHDCLPTLSSEKMGKTTALSENENIEENFLGSGLSKQSFIQISLFAAGLLITALVGIFVTLCVLKCSRKRKQKLRHLEAPLSNVKSKSKSISSDGLEVDAEGEYDELNDVRYAPLNSPRNELITMVPETTDAQTPESVEIPQVRKDSSTAYEKEENNYMDMRPFIHVLHKNNETTRNEPTSTIYESLGSLMDEENEHVYDALNEIKGK